MVNAVRTTHVPRASACVWIEGEGVATYTREHEGGGREGKSEREGNTTTYDRRRRAPSNTKQKVRQCDRHSTHRVCLVARFLQQPKRDCAHDEQDVQQAVGVRPHHAVERAQPPAVAHQRFAFRRRPLLPRRAGVLQVTPHLCTEDEWTRCLREYLLARLSRLSRDELRVCRPPGVAASNCASASLDSDDTTKDVSARGVSIFKKPEAPRAEKSCRFLPLLFLVPHPPLLFFSQAPHSTPHHPQANTQGPAVLRAPRSCPLYFTVWLRLDTIHQPPC
jgi:hypothetical protein